MLFDLVIILKTPEKVHCHFDSTGTCFRHVKTASLHDLLTALHKFQNKEDRPFSKFRLPSTWMPQPAYSNRLEDYLEGTLTEIASLPIRNAKSNITKAEMYALKAIRNDRSLIVKPFDKGRGIAL